MISYVCVIQNPFLTRTRQVFPGSVATLPPPIIIRSNYVLKFPQIVIFLPELKHSLVATIFAFLMVKNQVEYIESSKGEKRQQNIIPANNVD